VLVNICDRKIPYQNGNSNVDYYTADVVSASNYYPFVMQMPGGTFSKGSYRYGLNGKEKDNGVYGDGNQYDYGMKIYLTGVGRFLSMDPLTRKYLWNSPYSYSDGDPVDFIDLDGIEQNATQATTIPRPQCQVCDSHMMKNV
jgi:RHS repeat-associated protein